MKHFLLLLFFIFSLNISHAQDTTFNKLIKSYSGTMVINSILKFDNSYYCLFEQLDSFNPYNYQQIGIIKLNSLFSIVDSSIVYINKIIIPNNGSGFDFSVSDSSFIFGGTVKANSVRYNGYIVKFNKELDTLWTKQILHPDTLYADTSQTPWVALIDIKVTQTGDYLIVGNYNYHCQGNMYRSFIIKMDSSGNIIWDRLLDLNVSSSIKRIELNPYDSGFYFVTVVNQNMTLVKMDKDGNFIWSTHYITQQHPTIISNFKLLNSNSIIIASAYFKLPFNQSTYLILDVSKINCHTHLIEWEKTFSSINILSKYMNGETIDIEITKSNKIAIGTVGMKRDSMGEFYSDSRANILLLNNNGDSLWSHYYTYQNDSFDVEDMQFDDMVICDDGGFLFGGSYYSYPKDPMFQKAWLVKTDSNGIAPGAFTVSIEEAQLIIKKEKPLIYPNPTTDNFNLHFEENQKESFDLEIYNISGKLVLHKKLPPFENEYKIDIRALSSGVYFVKLLSENQMVYSSKIIKE